MEILKENGIMLLTVPHIKSNDFYPFVFFVVLLWLILCIFIRKDMYFGKKKVSFILTLIFVTVIISPFTLSQFQNWHLYILAPFMHIAVSIGILEFVRVFRNRILKRIALGAAYSLLLLVIGINMRVLEYYYREVNRTGGRDLWSSAIYDLADWIKRTEPTSIVALNFGLSRNLYFLLGGKKYIDDFNRPPQQTLSEQELSRIFRGLLDSKKTAVLIHIQFCTNADHKLLGLSRKIIDTAGKKIIEEKIFYQRNGKPIYIAYSVM
jgi:hypothetical protein